MKLLFKLLLLSLPISGFSQFTDKELYTYSRVGIGVGLTDINYSTVLNGNSGSNPQSVKLSIGGGFTTEIGLGLKIVNNFYLEPFVSYMFSSSNFQKKGQNTNITSFSSNRFNIGISGKYFIDVSSNMNLELYGGTSYRIPQDIVIDTDFGEERVVYSSALGLHGGFGGNYLHKKFVFNAGLRYRFEKYVLNTKQNKLPVLFEEINPKLDNLKITGIDIILSVMYNF